MDKGIKKRNNSYNTQVVKVLAAKYGFSEYYIRLCVSGERSSVNAERIREDYKRFNEIMRKKLNDFKEAAVWKD